MLFILTVINFIDVRFRLTIASNGIIVPIASKSKKEAEMIADKLNTAIQKFEKAQKQARLNTVIGGWLTSSSQNIYQHSVIK